MYWSLMVRILHHWNSNKVNEFFILERLFIGSGSEEFGLELLAMKHLVCINVILIWIPLAVYNRCFFWHEWFHRVITKFILTNSRSPLNESEKFLILDRLDQLAYCMSGTVRNSSNKGSFTIGILILPRHFICTMLTVFPNASLASRIQFFSYHKHLDGMRFDDTN